MIHFEIECQNFRFEKFFYDFNVSFSFDFHFYGVNTFALASRLSHLTRLKGR